MVEKHARSIKDHSYLDRSTSCKSIEKKLPAIALCVGTPQSKNSVNTA